MGNVMKSLKMTWLKGMEAVGNAASNIADNARYKVSEMNLETRRREILADFGSIAYEMWQQGEAFPPALEEQLKQLSALDDQLAAIRAQRYASAQDARVAREAQEEAAREGDALDQPSQDEGQDESEQPQESGGEQEQESSDKE